MVSLHVCSAKQKIHTLDCYADMAVLNVAFVLAVGVPHRTLLASHQKVQDKRSHGPDSSHSLHNRHHRCTRNCHSPPWRDPINTHTSSRVPSHDGLPPVSMGPDSLHWAAVHRLCHLHRGRFLHITFTVTAHACDPLQLHDSVVVRCFSMMSAYCSV